MEEGNREIVQFDSWKLLHRPLELFRDSTRIRIQDQPLMILESLLVNPGALVKREELIAKLWPRTVTDYEAGLHTAVRKLRAALDDDADTPRYIETVPRQGYRFIGAVNTPPRTSMQAESPELRTAPPPARSRWPAWAGMLAVVLAAGTWWWIASSNRMGRDAAQETWLSGVLAWQTVGGGGTTSREVDRVEDIFTRAIDLDPALAEAFADRARVRVGKFVAGYDTSEANIAAARADLVRAREIAGRRAFVLVNEARLAYLVDQDMPRALDLLRQAEAVDALDGDQLMTKANFLAFAGRQEESLPVYRQAARLDPGNPVIYRFWMVNLFSAHRPKEALQAVREFDSRIPGRIERGEWLFAYTGDTRRWRTEVEAANRVGRLPNGISNEFDLLRMEGNFPALQQLVEKAEPALFRPHSASRTVIGSAERPVAELRGWERLLAGDVQGAARAGSELDEFLARQSPHPWNQWSIRLLEAEAATLRGDKANGAGKAIEALRLLPQYPNFAVRAYSHMRAARVLAWCGENEEALRLLELLATTFPGVGPAVISRDPLLQRPLSGYPRWQELRARLEAQVAENQDLGS